MRSIVLKSERGALFPITFEESTTVVIHEDGREVGLLSFREDKDKQIMAAAGGWEADGTWLGQGHEAPLVNLYAPAQPDPIATFKAAAADARRAAEGGSNDEEIRALQEAVETAWAALGLTPPEED